MGAVATETVKNLVLGGINSIEILDLSTVKEEDFASQFFLPKDSPVGSLKLPLVEAAIRKLNPRVNLSFCSDPLAQKKGDYFGQFDLVIATELTKPEFLAVNDITRELSVPMYVSGMHGMFAYIFTDLIDHTSTKDHELGSRLHYPGTNINPVKRILHVTVDEAANKQNVTIHDTYFPLVDIFLSKTLPEQLNRRKLKQFSGALPLIFALFEIPRPEDVEDSINIALLQEHLLQMCENLNLPRECITDDYLTLFSKNAYTEFAPVAAIVGGMIAQDVIQFLGGKDSPINNCVIFDANRLECPIYYLH